MPGMVQVAGLVVSVGADSGPLKVDLAEASAIVQSSAQKIGLGFQAVTEAANNRTDAGKRLLAQLQFEIDTFGMSADQLRVYKASLQGVGDEAQSMVDRLSAMRAAQEAFGHDLESSSSALREHGAAVAEAGGHMEGFGFKTAGARRELLVLAHELSQGNFKRFGGSLMVLGEQTGAAGLLFSAAGIAAIGMGAAIVGVGAAILKGAEEQRAMNDALIETGNYAGATAESLNAMAHAAVTSGGSVGEAKRVVTELAGTGKFTSEQIASISDAAVAMEHATGKSIDKTIEEFESLAVQTSGNTMRSTEAITKAALKLDDQYHYLTESIYEQIRALEKDGQQKAASALATDTLAKVTKERAEEMAGNIGSIQRGWNSVKEAIGGVVDALGNIGKKATPQDAIDKYKAVLEHMDSQPGWISGRGQGGGFQQQFDESRLRVVQALNAAILEKNKADKAAADQGAAAIAQSEAMHAASRIQQDDAKLEKKGMTELQVAIREYGEDLAKIAAVNPKSPLLSQDAVNAHMAALMKAHTEAVKGNDDRAHVLQDALTIEQTALDGEKSIYESRDKMLELYHSKFGMSDDQFYAGRESARAEYLAAEAISFAKESALLKAAQANARNPEEVAAAKEKYDQLVKAHKKFVDDMRNASGADSAGAAAAAQVQYDAMIKSMHDAGVSEIQNLDQQIEKQREHNAEIGKTKEQIELAKQAQEDLATAQLQSDADYLRDGLAKWELDDRARAAYQIRLNDLDAEIERRRTLAGLLADGAVREADARAAADAANAWKHAANTIENDLTSAILDGGGKGWKKLIRDMEMAFAKLVLQPILEPISGGLATVLSPFMGNQTIGSSSGTGSASGLIGEAQTAASVYKAISSGFESLSGTVADTVQAGLYASGLSPNLLTNGAFATGAGAAASMAGGYFLGSGMNNAISGQYSTGSGLMTTEKIATAVASYFGPVAGAITGAVSGLINRTFGMGPTQLQSQGMSGTLTASSLTGDSYQNLHQSGGWFRSDKNWQNTTAFSAQTVAQFTQGLAAIEQASSGFAKSLGVDADWVSSYSKTFNIALTGDATKDAQAVTDFFNGVSDELANKLVPNLASFSKTGETASATLQRLAGDFQATDQAMQMIGKTATEAFGSAGMGSAAAREQLINAFGSASTLTSETQSYATDFLTNAQKLIPVHQALDAAMSSMGLSSVKTIDQFNAVIQSLDLTTQAGAQEFAQLMSLAGAFKQVYAAGKTADEVLQEQANLQDQINQLLLTQTQLDALQRAKLDPSNQSLFDEYQQAKAVAQAKADLATAYNTEVQSIQSTIDRLKSFSQSLHSFIDSLQLGSMSPLTPGEKYAAALSQFNDTLTKAKAGDITAQSNLQSVAQSFLQASQAANASNSTYQSDYQRVIAVSDQMATWADHQVTDGQASLNVLHDQVQQLVDINNGVMTVADAINNLAVVMAQGNSSNPSASGTSADTIAITNLYKELFNRAPDTAGLDFWISKLQSGVSLPDIISAMQHSTEYATEVTTGTVPSLGTMPSTSLGSTLNPTTNSVMPATPTDAASQIAAFYEQYLGRAPDAAGLNFWESAVANGTPLSEVANDIKGSLEAINPPAITPSQYVSPSQSSANTSSTSSVSSGQVVEQLAKLNTQVTQLINDQQKQADNQVDATMAAADNTTTGVSSALASTAQATAWNASNTVALR